MAPRGFPARISRVEGGTKPPDFRVAPGSAQRVFEDAAGGHDISEAKIRERYPAALRNLIALMPRLTHLQVYDNSVEVAPGNAVPDPVLVVELAGGKLTYPLGLKALQRTPEWAKPLVEAALSVRMR